MTSLRHAFASILEDSQSIAYDAEDARDASTDDEAIVLGRIGEDLGSCQEELLRPETESEIFRRCIVLPPPTRNHRSLQLHMPTLMPANCEGSSGPFIDGQQPVVSILSPEQLQQSGFLSSLVTTINAAYLYRFKLQPELKAESGSCLSSEDDLLSDMSSDPAAFVIVLSRRGSVEALGTASCAPFRGPPEGVSSPWVRNLEPQKGCKEWMLELMATHPSAQGHGLATFMLNLAEREVIRRSVQQTEEVPKQSHPTPMSAVKMALCTPKELNEAFYTKRGYQMDYEFPRGQGFNFHVTHMSKLLT